MRGRIIAYVLSAVATITAVGYGDFYPVTQLGRLTAPTPEHGVAEHVPPHPR